MQVCLRCQNPKSGFTLVEILVSMVIVSFLCGAIYVTFAQGIRVWHAAVRKSENGKHEFFFEQFKSDLRNAYQNGKIALTGQGPMIEFYTQITDVRGVDGDQYAMRRMPARIRYRFDPNKKVIYKETDFYEKILNPKSKVASGKPALQNVTGVKFEYYRHPSKESAASWLKDWTSSCLPEAVKITIDSNTLLGLKSARIFSLPAVANCPEEENG